MIFVGIGLVYLSFALIIIAGLWFDNNWVIAAGMIFILAYNPKPEIKLIFEHTKEASPTVIKR